METVRDLGSAHRPEPFWTVQALCDIGVPEREITSTRRGPWVRVPSKFLPTVIERAPELVARAALHPSAEYCGLHGHGSHFWIPAYGKPALA